MDSVGVTDEACKHALFYAQSMNVSPQLDRWTTQHRSSHDVRHGEGPEVFNSNGVEVLTLAKAISVSTITVPSEGLPRTSVRPTSTSTLSYICTLQASLLEPKGDQDDGLGGLFFW